MAFDLIASGKRILIGCALFAATAISYIALIKFGVSDTVSMIIVMSVSAPLFFRFLPFNPLGDILQRARASALQSKLREAAARNRIFSTSAATTAEEPRVVPNPVLGLVNLVGLSAIDPMKADLADLAAAFPGGPRIGSYDVPLCDVLFLYCTVEPSGRIAGQRVSLRDAIAASGAQIVVIALDNKPEVLTSPQFVHYLTESKDQWPANIVLTFNRNGAAFGAFFKALFAQMLGGVTMPLAWVTLAPQGRSPGSNEPGAVALWEGGHISFKTA